MSTEGASRDTNVQSEYINPHKCHPQKVENQFMEEEGTMFTYGNDVRERGRI